MGSSGGRGEVAQLGRVVGKSEEAVGWQGKVEGPAKAGVCVGGRMEKQHQGGSQRQGRQILRDRKRDPERHSLGVTESHRRTQQEIRSHRDRDQRHTQRLT